MVGSSWIWELGHQALWELFLIVLLKGRSFPHLVPALPHLSLFPGHVAIAKEQRLGVLQSRINVRSGVAQTPCKADWKARAGLGVCCR